MSNKQLYFLGRFPAKSEVGGVITFTQNFANYFKEKNITYVDIYPSEEKKIYLDRSSPLFLKGSLAKRLTKLFLLIFFSNGNWIFNFSTLNSLYLLFLLPKKKNQKWFVILHNGDQKNKFISLNFLKKLIIKFTLKKIDFLGAISSKQLEFYKELNVKNVFKISPQINTNKISKYKFNNNKKKIFLISGYPTKIYRILETLEIFKEIFNINKNLELNLCLYGTDSDLIRNDIILSSNKCAFINLYENLDKTNFEEILRSSDVYIRMNSVDSYGLVVAEAIQAGLNVIATDVCERYPGAYLIKPDDFITLKNQILFFLSYNRFSESLTRQEEDSNLTKLEYILDQILI